MGFQVGDQVVHSIYGVGEIIQVDEKKIAGNTAQYYVVQIGTLTLWVPVNSNGDSTLRYPTPASEFSEIFTILSGPAQPLAQDRLARKTQLADQIKDGKLASVCKAIRDLTNHRKTQKMNEYDTATLERIKTFLLNEWCISLSVPLTQARQDLHHLLGEEEMKTR
jgi:RNA polymerase-interacting CarD/CdnL/TRCF family regulator